MLEITLISANGLEDVLLIGKMEVHARVTAGNDPKTEKRTPTDTHGKTNPAWNYTVRFAVSDSSLENHGARIVIKLYCTRMLGDRYVGEVHMSVRELFNYGKPSGGNAILTYPVQRGSVKSEGELKFSYKFGESFAAENVPVERIVV